MKKKIVKPAAKKSIPARRKVAQKIPPKAALTKEELVAETEKISALLIALKNEMNEKFEKHENIILAEYRHRIETLETRVRELQALKK